MIEAACRMSEGVRAGGGGGGYVCLVSLDPGEQSIEADSQLNRSKARLKTIQSDSSVTFSCSDAVVVIQSIIFE